MTSQEKVEVGVLCETSFFFAVQYRGVSVPQSGEPGVEPMPFAVEVRSPNHWTTRAFLKCPYF